MICDYIAVQILKQYRFNMQLNCLTVTIFFSMARFPHFKIRVKSLSHCHNLYKKLPQKITIIRQVSLAISLQTVRCQFAHILVKPCTCIITFEFP